MTDAPDEARFPGFAAFAREAARPLFQTALLLTGDWHLAEDLVQETLAKTYRAWGGGVGAEHPLAYARTALVRTFLSHRRRRSSTELPVASLPDVSDASPGDVELRRTLIDALAQLSRRDRAWARKWPKVVEALPLLYLRGLSSGDFGPALVGLQQDKVCLLVMVGARRRHQGADALEAWLELGLDKNQSAKFYLSHRPQPAPRS